MFDNGELFHIPDNIHTRWASAENGKGEKGVGGQAKGGRKGSPMFGLREPASRRF